MNRTSPKLLDSQICPPLVATLLYGKYMAEILPRELCMELERQSKERRELLKSIDATWTTALDHLDSTKSEEVENLILFYNQLCNFIESDNEHHRIVLYLPFEILPDYSFRSSSRRLNKVIKRFVETYLYTWRLLLDSFDIRENFSNGDIIDSEYDKGESPCVSKAAHLIPILVLKRLMSISEVFTLIKNTTNKVVKNSIADSIGVLVDMNLLSQDDFEEMRTSNDLLLARLFIIFNNEKDIKKVLVPSVQELFQQQLNAIESIDEDFLKNTIDRTSRRAIWERKDSIERITEIGADQLFNLMKDGCTTVEEITSLVAKSCSTTVIITGLIALRKLCEYLWTYDPELSRHHTESILLLMKTLSTAGSSDIQQCVEITLYHWSNIGLLAKSNMSCFGLQSRDLKKGHTGTLSNDEKTNMKKLCQFISNDTTLSQYLYPVVAIYGSKVKGYALSHTDNDIAFFIKPEVLFSDRSKIQNILSEVLVMCDVQETPLEVWLERKENILQIRDVASTDACVARSSMVYVLLQSIWVGDMDVIQNFYQYLVAPYFSRAHGSTIENRNIWSREMERDMLQYRLLHKGYARFYPTLSPFIGNHANDIDGTSTFWDSGYRKVATKLFIRNVYIPKLNL
jgi:hypothetical protein